MLPYLDQGAMYNSWNFNDVWSAGNHRAFAILQIPAYRCPTEGMYYTDQFLGTDLTAYSRWPTKQTTYGEYWGDTDSIGNQTGDLEPRGMFMINKSVRIADVTDGTSNTLMCSEIIPMYPAQYGWPNCDPARPAAPHMHNWIWTNGNSKFGAGINTLSTPNSPIPDCVTELGRSTGDVADMGRYAARSDHAGGVFALTADGAVNFISDNIDLKTYKALASRAGGEAVTLP